MQVTVTELDKYLELAQTEDIWITKRGRIYGKMVKATASDVDAISGALKGLVPPDLDRHAIREQRLADRMEKYAALDD